MRDLLGLATKPSLAAIARPEVPVEETVSPDGAAALPKIP